LASSSSSSNPWNGVGLKAMFPPGGDPATERAA
jgi:hypothetical protein